MRAISNHFAIISPDLIRDSLKMGESVSIPVGSDEFRCQSPVVFGQNARDADSGMTYDQTFRAVTDDQGAIRHNGSKAYIGIIFTDGTVEVMGSAWCVPTVTVTPHQGVMVVEASFQALSPIVL